MNKFLLMTILLNSTHLLADETWVLRDHWLAQSKKQKPKEEVIVKSKTAPKRKRFGFEIDLGKKGPEFKAKTNKGDT